MLPRPLLLVATSLAAALALCPLRQGYQNLTLTHGGLARRALVFAPTASPASPPALFALHGVTTTAEDLAQASGLDAVAAANAFLLVFPDGLDASWNAGFAAPPSAYPTINIDDVGFLRALAEELVGLGCADEERLYLAGHSNGGFMAYRAACEASDTFAAIAPVSGQMGDRGFLNGGAAETVLWLCSPYASVPVVHIHGRDDATVMLNGTVAFGSNSAVARPVADVIEFWRANNGVARDAAEVTNITTPDPANATVQHSVRCERKGGAGTSVTLCLIDNWKHTFPQKLVASVLWDMLKVHRRTTRSQPRTWQCLLPTGAHNITYNRRRALVYRPAGVATPMPLVVGLHGLTNTPETLLGELDYFTLAQQQGFLAMYPEGHGKSWNAGFAAPPAAPTVEDVSWIRGFVRYLQTLRCITPRRTYATGFSNGGFMAYRLACEASDVFAAVAPVSGLMGDKGFLYHQATETTLFQCSPTHKVPVLHVHGLADPTVMVNGTVQFGAYYADSRPLAKVAELWAGFNGCANTTAVTYQRSKTTCSSMTTGCGDAGNVTVCRIQGLVHQVPNPSEFDAASHAWQFFKRHTRSTVCPLAAGSYNISFTYANITRRVGIFVPTAASSGPVPLIVGLHGLTNTPEHIRALLNIEGLAQSSGFVVVYPEGIDKSWNAGFAAPPANMKGIDDVGFLRALVAHLDNIGCVDSDRVYATGHSNGGFMAYRLACEASDVFAAVAPFSANMADWGYLLGQTTITRFWTCSPEHRVPVLHVHGLADDIIMLNGTVQFGQYWAVTHSVAEVINAWATRNGCDNATSTKTLSDTKVTCNSYTGGCGDSGNVTFCQVVGLAHAMPLTQMDIAGQVWGFFSRYTRSTAGQGSEIESSSSSAAVAPVKSSSAAARSSSAALRSSHGSHASEASVSVTPVVCLVLALVAVLLC